ncbi:MAG: cation-binding protein, partial [Deltaproteobacteria bacterium]|nr:cation-binding protein [Deltaproteobacteria bacterium]
MLPIGPLMIEHRLIEKMIKVMKGQLDHIQTGKPVSSPLIETITDFIRAYADRCH